MARKKDPKLSSDPVRLWDIPSVQLHPNATPYGFLCAREINVSSHYSSTGSSKRIFLALSIHVEDIIIGPWTSESMQVF
jgi:hypothetical protein